MGDVQNAVEVANIEQTAQPAAEAAGQREAAVQDARLGTQRAYDAGAARTRMDGSIRTTQGMIDSIDEILSHEGLAGATGLSGTIDPRSYIPGQANVDAKKLIDTLKNRVFIDTLQAMRANSQTGGAVGNVSDKEGSRLENAIASLDNAQSDQQFQEQLRLLKNIAQDTIKGYEDAYAAQFGDVTQQSSDEALEDIMTIINRNLPQ